MDTQSLLSWITFLPFAAGLVLLATGVGAKLLDSEGLPDAAWWGVGLAATTVTWHWPVGRVSSVGASAAAGGAARTSRPRRDMATS